jgi:hypothetical protein
MNKSKKRTELDDKAAEHELVIQEVKGYFVKSVIRSRFDEGVFLKTLDDVNLYFFTLNSN